LFHFLKMPVTAIKQLFSIALILLLPELVMAQMHKQKTVDSLLILISKAPEDTSKIDLLNKLSFTYYNIDPKKGIDFANQALKMSEKIGWKKGIASAYNYLGSNYWAKYDFIRAQDYYGTSLRIAEEIGDKLEIERDIHNIGTCYEGQNNYSKALEYFQRASTLSANMGDKDRELGCFSNMADVYVKQSKYDDALKFYKKSLQLSREIGNRRNIGYFYQQIGNINSLSGNINEALKYEERALQIFQKLRDYEDAAPDMSSLGNLYLQKGDFQQAILQNQNALKIIKEIKGSSTKKMEADVYYSIGKAYFKWAAYANNILHKSVKANNKTGYIQLASENFQKSAGIAESIDYKETVIESLKNLSDVETMQGHFANALKIYKEYIIYRDSSYNSEKDKEYSRHELAFEYTKKRDSLNYASNLEKKEAEKAKTLAAYQLRQGSLYAIVVIVVLLLFISYFVFRNRLQKIGFKSELAKEKSEAKLTQLLFENKLNDLTLASLKSQMKPHFIFNCLNSIKFYIEKNETEAASLYITKFSKLIRNILDSSRLEKVTLSKEIELIELYLEMEAMRLKEKLHYEFEIAKNIDIDFIELPPLLIQPYVENAIWHGLMPKELGGNIKLSIDLSTDEKYLIFGVADNGVGREKAAELKRKSIFQHTSHGGDLNSERIAMINAKYNTNTEVIITDLNDADNKACGTLVTIKLLIQ
jgi:tetratricopeptide (TPR) repeat protein